ncbi:hypothetical protein PR048_015872 [Dryococelus australis]|uniref:Uncharacterized protein n=1 Tax=Dryococelus australis TaxID=614101 RepID=A0ABQ9HIC3_9NEOP|nr:hypothetical protein PR048_015872 [Dryococelus australis]
MHLCRVRTRIQSDESHRVSNQDQATDLCTNVTKTSRTFLAKMGYNAICNILVKGTSFSRRYKNTVSPSKKQDRACTFYSVAPSALMFGGELVCTFGCFSCFLSVPVAPGYPPVSSPRTARLPPRRTGFNPRPGHRIFASGNRVGQCRWSADFPGELPFPPTPSLRHHSIFTSITHIGSQDLAVKSRPNLFTHSLWGVRICVVSDNHEVSVHWTLLLCRVTRSPHRTRQLTTVRCPSSGSVPAVKEVYGTIPILSDGTALVEVDAATDVGISAEEVNDAGKTGDISLEEEICVEKPSVGNIHTTLTQLTMVYLPITEFPRELQLANNTQALRLHAGISLQESACRSQPAGVSLQKSVCRSQSARVNPDLHPCCRIDASVGSAIDFRPIQIARGHEITSYMKRPFRMREHYDNGLKQFIHDKLNKLINIRNDSSFKSQQVWTPIPLAAPVVTDSTDKGMCHNRLHIVSVVWIFPTDGFMPSISSSSEMSPILPAHSTTSAEMPTSLSVSTCASAVPSLKIGMVSSTSSVVIPKSLPLSNATSAARPSINGTVLSSSLTVKLTKSSMEESTINCDTYNTIARVTCLLSSRICISNTSIPVLGKGSCVKVIQIQYGGRKQDDGRLLLWSRDPLPQIRHLYSTLTEWADPSVALATGSLAPPARHVCRRCNPLFCSVGDLATFLLLSLPLTNPTLPPPYHGQCLAPQFCGRLCSRLLPTHAALPYCYRFSTSSKQKKKSSRQHVTCTNVAVFQEQDTWHGIAYHEHSPLNNTTGTKASEDQVAEHIYYRDVLDVRKLCHGERRRRKSSKGNDHASTTKPHNNSSRHLKVGRSAHKEIKDTDAQWPGRITMREHGTKSPVQLTLRQFDRAVYLPDDSGYRLLHFCVLSFSLEVAELTQRAARAGIKYTAPPSCSTNKINFPLKKLFSRKS